MAHFHYISPPVKLLQIASMDKTRAFPKWNAAIINLIKYTCAFPTMTRQNVCCENKSIYKSTSLGYMDHGTYRHISYIVKNWAQKPPDKSLMV